MRNKRETTPLPARERQLAEHDRETISLLHWVLWLNLVALALLACLFFVGCGPLPNDRGWLTNQQHHWNYRWTPLTVKWDREEFDDHNASMELAMEHFPCDMFQEHTGDQNPDVEVFDADGSHERCGNGPFVYNRDDAQAFVIHCSGFAEIYLAGSTYALNTTQSYLVFTHELGHVAGLEHDGIVPGFCPSIMYPNTMAHSKALEEGRCVPMLTPDDRDRLESRYCR